jgi:hypothetical protein
MAASVPYFVCFEVGNLVNRVYRLLAPCWQRSMIAMLRMKTIVYVAVELGRAMKPWANADKNSACKPFRAVVPIGSAVVWRDVIVAIRTIRRNADIYAHLSLCRGSGYQETDRGKGN